MSGLAIASCFISSPRAFYQTLGLQLQLAKGMAWHFTAMWIFALNVLVYLVALLRSREWRHTVPTVETFRRLPSTLWAELRGKKQQLQGPRFNPAQRRCLDENTGWLAGKNLKVPNPELSGPLGQRPCCCWEPRKTDGKGRFLGGV